MSRIFLQGTSGPAEPTTIAEEKAYFAEVGESAYTWTTSASGRQFARCKCDHGTIMKWNDVGTTRYTIVLDAKYRTKSALYSNRGTNLNLTKFTSRGYFSSTGSSISLPADPTQFTDTSLNNRSVSNQDTRSSTVATNEWQNSSYYGTNMAAAYYVRNTLSSNEEVGSGCDMPTINCLTRIFGDMSLLDSMDPTVSSYSSYSLVSWSFGGYDRAWSSSWYGDFGDCYYALDVYNGGYVYLGNQDGSYGVVPVLDM